MSAAVYFFELNIFASCHPSRLPKMAGAVIRKSGWSPELSFFAVSAGDVFSWSDPVTGKLGRLKTQSQELLFPNAQARIPTMIKLVQHITFELTGCVTRCDAKLYQKAALAFC